jgi:hypothetical protein
MIYDVLESVQENYNPRMLPLVEFEKAFDST